MNLSGAESFACKKSLVIKDLRKFPYHSLIHVFRLCRVVKVHYIYPLYMLIILHFIHRRWSVFSMRCLVDHLVKWWNGFSVSQSILRYMYQKKTLWEKFFNSYSSFILRNVVYEEYVIYTINMSKFLDNIYIHCMNMHAIVPYYVACLCHETCK